MHNNHPFRCALVNAAAVTTVASIAAPTHSFAGQPSEVVVTATLTMEAWSSTVSQDLERSLATVVNPAMQHRRVPTGLVSVRFRVSESGTPLDIEVSHKSGSVALDSIGKEAVARLRPLPTLPVGLGVSQVFEANIIVAADRRDHARQLAALRQRETQLMAAGQSRSVAALNAAYDRSAPSI